MIKAVQDYLETLYPNITFGQIQDSPNTLINVNVYDKGNNPFFDGDAHILTLDLYIRDESFENMITSNEDVTNSLLDTYDKSISNYHIVRTKKESSQEPSRDEKNRYSIYSTYEILIEKMEG